MRRKKPVRFNQRPRNLRNTCLRFWGSGGTGHPTPPEASATGTPAPAPPRGAGHITEGWMAEPRSLRALPPRENTKRPPSPGTPTARTAPLARECAAAHRPDTHRATEPPSHPPLPPPDHGGQCRRPLSQTRHDQWCKGRPPAASDAANHEAPLSMSCVGARQQMPSCLGNLPSESLPLASIPACFLQHRTGCRSGCSPGAGTARCAVG